MAVSSLKNKSKLSTLTSPFDIDLGGMIPLSTVTVGVGGQASVEFNNIPGYYEHLQIRALAQTNRGTFGRDLIKLTVNSDTGNNYSWHELVGVGSVAAASAASTTNTILKLAEVGTSTGGAFGVFICDVLDYKNTNKYTTFRSLYGGDHNGVIEGFGGTVGMNSGLWQNTNAVTSLTFTPNAGSAITQYSSFALYGIKRAGA